jgi:hypothetical protein
MIFYLKHLKIFIKKLLDTINSFSKVAGYKNLFTKIDSFSFFFLFTYSHIHTLFGSFLPPAPTPTLPSQPPSLPGRTCYALFSNFVEDKT